MFLHRVYIGVSYRVPRKPSFAHPLRQIRTAVGKTQPEFAQMVGCSAPTIRGIENGQRGVTQELAERIMDETGVWPFCLTEPWEEACDLQGEPYTAVSFLRFKEGLDEEFTKRDWRAVGTQMSHILEAAEKVGKSHLLIYYFSKALAEVVERLDLEDSLYSVFEQISIEVGQEITVRQMRDNPDLAKALGFRDDPKLPDGEIYFSKLTPQHATKRSPHCSRWDNMDVEAPWFISQSRTSGELPKEARKIFGADKVKTKYQIRQGAKLRAQMAVSGAQESQS